MRRTVFLGLETVLEAALTAGFLLVWLAIWPLWRLVRTPAWPRRSYL